MSDDKMRQAFEVWAWENGDSHFPDFSKDESDDRTYWGRVTELAWRAWQAAQRHGGESVTYWVLYDSESPRKYIKKAPDGCLAFFDNESDAKRMKRKHKGVNYKMVTYYTNPQPQPAVPEDFREAAQRGGGEAVSWEPSGKEYDHAIHTNPDAKAWADLFMETFPNCGADPDLMCGWFANAMMPMHDHIKNNEEDAQGCEPLGFHGALKLANSVVNAYCQDNPKWRKKIAGTPIPNDLAVRMAKVFAGFYPQPQPAVPEDFREAAQRGGEDDDEVGIYEDVYEQITDTIEPYVIREGGNPDAFLPASAVESVSKLLDMVLASQKSDSQSGEAVAWRVSHPDKGWEVYQQYPAWAEGDFVIQPLYTAPQPQPAVPEGDWIACSERLPTEADADLNSQVWLGSPKAGCILVRWSTCSSHPKRYWKPTGLKRPEPPEEDK